MTSRFNSTPPSSTSTMQRQNSASPKALAPSPFADFGLSLRTAWHHHRRESDSASASPSALSSATASPTSSPGSTFHSLYRKHRLSSSNQTDVNSRSRSRSPFSSFISFRRGPFFIRRRPSAVDLALSEERSRCDEDEIERMGLSMMEPRPVDPVPIAMDLNANVLGDVSSERTSWVQSQNQALRVGAQHPRYVMGGIFEVMEGQA